MPYSQHITPGQKVTLQTFLETNHRNKENTPMLQRHAEALYQIFL